MTAPMTHPLTPREKVAATLDPEIWADDMPVPTRAAVTDFHARRQASIVKADAILTALASGSGDHAELARLAEAVGLIDRAAELMRQCTDPERFEGVSTINVYANMRAWLSDLSKEAERG